MERMVACPVDYSCTADSREAFVFTNLTLTGGGIEMRVDLFFRRLAKAVAVSLTLGLTLCAYASWTVVLLGPAGAVESSANGVGNVQDGVAGIGGTGNAGMWSGEAGCWLGLHCPGSYYKVVLLIRGDT